MALLKSGGGTVNPVLATTTCAPSASVRTVITDAVIAVSRQARTTSLPELAIEDAIPARGQRPVAVGLRLLP